MQIDGARGGCAGHSGDGIEARALSQLGVPFRLHGRRTGNALDCIGLVAYAFWGEEGLGRLPATYSMRGHHRDWLSRELHHRGLRQQCKGSPVKNEDIVIFCPSSRQLHLGIALQQGLVHAHAGLGRITLTPSPWPWQKIAVWRQIGD